MNTVLNLTHATCMVALVLTLLFIALEIRRIRLQMTVLNEQIVSLPARSGTGSRSLGDPGQGSTSGYAVYAFRQGAWVLAEDFSAPGCEPSAPTIPGSYEGQTIRKESRPSGGL